MPIRPDLRPLYKTPEAVGSRCRALERAGGRFDEKSKYLGGARCEQCGVPDREPVARGTAGTWFGTLWHTCTQATFSGHPVGPVRRVYIILTVAHLDHDPRNNRDENRKALCQWCHLNWDKLHHKQTRQTRKDAARPLLAEAP